MGHMIPTSCLYNSVCIPVWAQHRLQGAHHPQRGQRVLRQGVGGLRECVGIPIHTGEATCIASLPFDILHEAFLLPCPSQLNSVSTLSVPPSPSIHPIRPSRPSLAAPLARPAFCSMERRWPDSATQSQVFDHGHVRVFEYGHRCIKVSPEQ
jgi:hypothetical protein